jgi:hypothetical protein
VFRAVDRIHLFVEEQAEEGETMERKSILKIMLMTAIALAMSAITVSAEALGADYSVYGVQVGWWLIAIGAVILILGKADIISKDIILGKAIVIFIALIVIGALLVVPMDTPAQEADTTGKTCPDFEITGSAINTGTDYIGDTVWDEDTYTLTVPLTVQDSSDGNLTGHKAGLNLTFDPVGSGYETTQIVTVTFSSDYLMKYGGEYILDEDSTGHMAIWTTTEGTEYYDDQIDITAESSDWAQIDYTFVNATAGSWVTELDAIGDTKSWYINLANDCGTWSQTVTITAIVVSYTA